MLTRGQDVVPEMRAAMRNGPGSVKVSLFKEFLPPKVRLFGLMTLGKGDGIGRHDHVDETEIYYMLSGEAVADDNGAEIILKPGDALFTGGGAFHAIRNEKDEPVQFLAAIVLD